MSRKLALLIFIAFSAFHSTGFSATLPCSDQRFDPDRDGWGWENSASCRMRYPLCTAKDDPDGDGWGSISDKFGLRTQHCLVFYPDCARENSDQDGDGWGWENLQSCLVPLTVSADDAGLPYIKQAYGNCFPGDICQDNAIEPNKVKISGNTNGLSPFPLCEEPQAEGYFSLQRQEFCMTVEPSLRCGYNAIPLASDGWAWENGRLCVEEQNILTQCNASQVDINRDGLITDPQDKQVCIVPSQETQNITFTKGHIVDTKGNVFVPRGIQLSIGNNPHRVANAIHAIAETKANMIDLHLTTDTTAANLDSAIAAAITREMITLISIDTERECHPLVTPQPSHDFTRSWINWVPILLKEEYQPYLILGLANGNNCHELQDESVSFAPKIAGLRSAGLTTPLVITPWINPIASVNPVDMGRYNESMSADPENNIFVSFDSNISDNLPLLVQDLRHFNIAHISRLTFRLLTLNESHIHDRHINELNNSHSGWVAESWASYLASSQSPGAIYVSDSYISLSYDFLEPTEYGRKIVNAIQNTSVKASVFAK